MNRRMRVLTTFSVFLLFVCVYLFFNSNSFGSEKSEETEVRKVLEQYEKAVKKFDTDEMLKVSLDLSWPDIKQYERNLKKLDEQVFQFETVSLKKVEDKLYVATILVESETMEEMNMDFAILKLNGKWKLILGYDLDNPKIESASYYEKYFTDLRR